MQKRKNRYRILLIVAGILLTGCLYLNTNYFIANQQWKHRDGESIGDWIEFDNTLYKVSGRTIYKNNIAAGKIVFCFGKMLIVKNITTGQTGNYTNKANF